MLKDKYFTPEITEAERWQLFIAMGLNKFRYLFVESVKEALLRVEEHGLSEPKPHLQITSRSVLEDFRKTYLFPIIEVHHSGNKTEVLAPIKNTFWNSIFPFPFSEIKEGFSPLREALTSLEKKLLGAEVGVVFFKNHFEEFTLVTHSVRGSMIRVGTSEEVAGFLSTFRGASPSPKDLEIHFGTSVTYIKVEPVMSEEWQGFQALSDALSQGVQNTVSTVWKSAESEAVTGIQL